MKDKKTITILIRLAVSAIVWLVSFFVLPDGQKNLGFAVAYMIIGYDVITEGYEHLFSGKIFNRHLIITIASLTVYMIGHLSAGVLTMWLYQLDELLCEAISRKAERVFPECTGEEGKTDKGIKRFCEFFAPIMFVVAILTAGFYSGITGHPFKEALYVAAIILIISGPEQFAKSVEMSYRYGLNLLRGKGLDLDSSREIEDIANTSRLRMLKKDLVSTGELSVVQLVTDLKEDDFLKKACSLLSKTESPFYDALLSFYGKDRELNILRGYKEEAGKGVRALIGPKEYFLGSKEYLAEQGLEIEDVPEDAALHLASKSGLLGSVVFEDKIIDGISEEVKNLRQLGFKSIGVITNDKNGSGEKLIGNTGIDTVIYECEDKGNELYCASNALDANGTLLVTERLGQVAEARKVGLRTMSMIRTLMIIFTVGKAILLVLTLSGVLHCYMADIAVLIMSVIMTFISTRE